MFKVSASTVIFHRSFRSSSWSLWFQSLMSLKVLLWCLFRPFFHRFGIQIVHSILGFSNFIVLWYCCKYMSAPYNETQPNLNKPNDYFVRKNKKPSSEGNEPRSDDGGGGGGGGDPTGAAFGSDAGSGCADVASVAGGGVSVVGSSKRFWHKFFSIRIRFQHRSGPPSLFSYLPRISVDFFKKISSQCSSLS